MAERQMSIVRMPGKVLIIPTIPALAAFLAILLLSSAIVLVLSTLRGVQFGHDLIHPNPFTPYESLWPGQSITSVAEYARRTQKGSISCNTGVAPHEVYTGLEIYSNLTYSNSSYDTPDNQIVCLTDNRAEFFRAMRVTLVDNRVQELILFSDVLQQDTLLFYWGIPDSIKGSTIDELMYMNWNRDTYGVVAMITKSDSKVKFLRLTAKG